MFKTSENVAVLVKNIIEKDPGMIRVKDSALIPYYISKAKYMFEVEPEDKADLVFFHGSGFDNIKKQVLSLAEGIGANYIFISTYKDDEYDHKCISTPFAIISEGELEFLIMNYYKDVPKEVSEAAKDLGIALFDEYYTIYMENSNPNFGFSSSNADLRDSFFGFIFALPYEEQNIEANKLILHNHYNHIPYRDILAKEYSQGNYFRDYFDSLNYDCKIGVLLKINSLERNIEHDLFLLKKGYVVEGLDLVAVYKEDGEAFINHFKKLEPDVQRFIIEQIYDEPFENQEVIDWLNENYALLLKEVGFLGGK